MKQNRVETTLFMLMSVDGKINSGATDELDPDKDWKQIAGDGFLRKPPALCRGGC
ncbi:hypothetical protein SAMN05660649_00557 [Desulfotomaculum arcticum]|uniref:RibD C-terminal domain-containing protein n=1 Tax=Desulfotruncus arcticus DSM 17038 TaxID=1121424 RepID=A0A1I2NZP7_9FIRM|nr:hypothetical protein SAMN05660649_00557 [Desulfotomaculum arcticum] [Desulfotruncus arcticus DSM 17038]